MSSIGSSKYTPEEQSYITTIKNTLIPIGYPEQDAEQLAIELLEKAIKEAEAVGLRGVCNLQIQDAMFLQKRFNAGLTKEDILLFWNRDYVWLLIEFEIANILRFPVYKQLITEGKTSKEAVKLLRKSMPYFGDPELSHVDWHGEDADIYPEFRARFDRWRNKFSTIEIHKMLEPFSTYNAMIRYYIKKGDI